MGGGNARWWGGRIEELVKGGAGWGATFLKMRGRCEGKEVGEVETPVFCRAS